MSTAITTTPAKTRISTLEALRQLDSFIRSSEIARDYEHGTFAAVVADVIKRAELRKASKGIMPRADQISMYLNSALDAMKASDPWMASFIENLEEAFPKMEAL
jgi:hypothetical protein